ncbi:restriction endonuclease subunit S [Vibrio cholerae]
MTFPSYDCFKSIDADWLGKVPSHWEVARLRYLFKRVKRTNCPEKELLSVYRDYGVIPKNSRDDNHNKPSDDLSPYQLVESGDLVMNKMKAWQGSIAISEYEGIVSPAYFVYSFSGEGKNSIHSKYVHYLLRSPAYITQYMARSKGIRVNQWDLEPEAFEHIEVLLPTIEEQKAIATFLDRETQRIDSLIEEKQTFIKLLKEKRQALISHVVTKGLNPNVEMQDSGIEWIGQVPKRWVVKKIKYDVLSIEQGWSPQCESTPVPDDHTWGVVKVGCVNRGIFNPEQNKKLPEELEPRKEYTIKKGDLLVSRANAKEWVGSAAVPDRDYDNLLLCDKIYRIKLDLEKADPEFFAYYLASDQAREQIEIDATGTSSSMLNIGQGTILNMPIPAPELQEQQSIVQGIKNKTSQIDRLMLEVLDSIELLKEHRTSLISAAVTGKIDVRETV